jgi:nitronate monooxygenase
LFGLEHPIVSAPMGSVSGGALAAAVSEAGGLGLVGGGYGDPDWLHAELARAAEGTSRPWGAGLITWAIDAATVALVLEYRPRVVLLSFGDPAPYAAAVHDAGAVLCCQVQDVEMARAAVAAGADFVVAQGAEAGGHGAVRATLPLVPAVVDAVAPVPVIAAGGIADGRGVAAALMLGAQGAMLGTRFYASAEALGSKAAKHAITAASGDQTARTRVFDAARGYRWPVAFTGRALRNAFLERWEGREEQLAADDAARAEFARAHGAGELDDAMVWAGECTDLIADVAPAGDLVAHIAAEAERVLCDIARRGDSDLSTSVRSS